MFCYRSARKREREKEIIVCKLNYKTYKSAILSYRRSPAKTDKRTIVRKQKSKPYRLAKNEEIKEEKVSNKNSISFVLDRRKKLIYVRSHCNRSEKKISIRDRLVFRSRKSFQIKFQYFLAMLYETL